MQTLARLADIRVTRDVPTAAVECKRRPALLINPDFVRQYCPRDEHLFLLVMHELWHVLLAHTRLNPRMTQAQNIAFDAVINAGLMKEFYQGEYRGFFEAVNPADQFPHLLLRPPVGWPNDPIYPDNIGPAGTRDLLMRLYPPGNFSNFSPPLYEEVLRLLIASGMVAFEGVVLLGSHDGSPIRDPVLKETIERAAAKWPKLQINGPGEGDYLHPQHFSVVDPRSEAARRMFSRILKICLSHRPGSPRRKAKVPVDVMSGSGVLPNGRDRLMPARRQLGAPSTLWTQQTPVRVRLPERPGKAYVYLDVSGSMNAMLSSLLGLLLPYVAKGHADVFQFSTAVTPLPLRELQRGLLTTTGGTDINCVLEHILAAKPRIDRVLLLTDGETGSPLPHLAQRAQEHHLKLNVVLPEDCQLDAGVVQLANSVVMLPPLSAF
jgi:hypothetical protein